MLRAAFAVMLAGAVLASGAAATQQPKIPVPQVPPDDVDPKMPFFRVAAKAADDCARLCDLCAAHCAKLVADGRKEHLDTLKTCLDCATLCRAASAITAKDGPMTDLVSQACADACKRCGDACEKHASDPIMKRCAEECRKCEKACRDMHKQAATRPAK
jgi:hypothetical protein